MFNNKIMVIDDDPDINKLISYNLSKEGFSVEQAFCGKEALAKLKNRYFSVVVLDINLPEINGFDICQEIRRNQSADCPFIIIVSARSSSQDKLYAYLLGADYYLSKPFSLIKLMAMIKEVQLMQNRVFSVLKP